MKRTDIHPLLLAHIPPSSTIVRACIIPAVLGLYGAMAYIACCADQPWSIFHQSFRSFLFASTCGIRNILIILAVSGSCIAFMALIIGAIQWDSRRTLSRLSSAMHGITPVRVSTTAVMLPARHDKPAKWKIFFNDQVDGMQPQQALIAGIALYPKQKIKQNAAIIHEMVDCFFPGQGGYPIILAWPSGYIMTASWGEMTQSSTPGVDWSRLAAAPRPLNRLELIRGIVGIVFVNGVLLSALAWAAYAFYRESVPTMREWEAIFAYPFLWGLPLLLFFLSFLVLGVVFGVPGLIWAAISFNQLMACNIRLQRKGVLGVATIQSAMVRRSLFHLPALEIAWEIRANDGLVHHAISHFGENAIALSLDEQLVIYNPQAPSELMPLEATVGYRWEVDKDGRIKLVRA